MFKLAGYFCCLLLLSACATHQSRMSPAQKDLLGGNCAQAIQTLGELSEKNSDDRLLYLIEYGSLGA